MAKHMVLTYLHQLDPEIPIEQWLIDNGSYHGKLMVNQGLIDVNRYHLQKAVYDSLFPLTMRRVDPGILLLYWQLPSERTN